MAVEFNTVWNELIGQVDGLDPFSAKKYVQRALDDICNQREWGFLRGRAVVQIPDAVTTGTVALTQFDTAIQFDAAAAAVLDVFGLNPPVTQCQIKIGALGGAYSITEYTPGGAAVLDRAYQEDTDAAATYTLLRCFISPPDDFLRFISINDTLRAKTMMFGPQWTQQTLDRYDPQRIDTSEPYVFATYVYRDGHTQYEIWPNPTVGQVFLCEYRKRGVELVSGDDLPDAIGADLVLSRAKYRAYEFGAAHATQAWKVQQFLALMKEANTDYTVKLRDYKKLDKAQNPDTVIIQNDWAGFIYDASWIQSHAGFGWGYW
jgi:hypothetical protein